MATMKHLLIWQQRNGHKCVTQETEGTIQTYLLETDNLILELSVMTLNKFIMPKPEAFQMNYEVQDTKL